MIYSMEKKKKVFLNLYLIWYERFEPSAVD